MKKKTKIKKHIKVPKITKKELVELKAAYKSGKLKFDAKKVAESILEEEHIKRGLTRPL